MPSTSSSNSNSTSSNKKLKTNMTDEIDEFQIAKDYILKCPNLKPDSPAIRAALEGIEKEEKRRIRDAKLRNKFGNNNKSKSSVTTPTGTNNNNASFDEIVVVEKETGLETSNNNLEEDMEWQDVRQQQSDVPAARTMEESFTAETSDNELQEDCFLGQTLAKACIDAIAFQAQQNKPVQVSTPLAAVAVALHTCLRSDVLGFACTGIPEAKPMKGFAPPIRELSSKEFLPKHWDHPQSSPEPLRYRKRDTSAVVLTVEGNPKENSIQTDTTCKVTFCPANGKENRCLEFPLNEHINLDSWNAAKLKSSHPKIAPSLHYKNLSGLLSKFCRKFDLGAVPHEDTAMGGMVPPMQQCKTESVFVPSSQIETKERGYPIPTRLDQAFPPTAMRRPMDPYSHPHGDFASDLLPAGGLHDPRFGQMPGMMPGMMPGGNLMGPNHPAFGNYPGSLPMGGPGTMQPRFDPIVPPGIGDEIPPPGKPRPRTMRGEPNPDHLRPPNSLGNNNDNNMFM